MTRSLYLCTLASLAACATQLPPAPAVAPLSTAVHDSLIPVIDLDAFVAEKVKSGFFFWDVVHPTSYGHRAIAGKLHDELVPLLGRK